MLFIFSTPVLIRHLWQLKTVVFMHWCLICAVLLLSCLYKLSVSNDEKRFCDIKTFFDWAFPGTHNKLECLPFDIIVTTVPLWGNHREVCPCSLAQFINMQD